MPIDPRIPMGIRTPRIQSPLESYGKMMSLRDLAGRVKSRETYDDYLAERTATSRQQREHAQSPAYQEDLRLKRQKEQAEVDKTIAELDEKKRKRLKEKTTKWIQHLGALFALPHEQRAVRFPVIARQVCKDKLISKQECDRFSSQGYAELEPDLRQLYESQITIEQRLKRQEAKSKESLERFKISQRPPENRSEFEQFLETSAQEIGKKSRYDLTSGEMKQLRTEWGQATPERGITKEERKGNIEAIAEGVMEGSQPPTFVGMAREGLIGGIRAHMARNDYDLARAEIDWNAVRKHIGSLNSTKQLSLRQVIETVDHTLGLLEEKFDAWKATGWPRGARAFNSAALKVAMQLPGEPGAAAQALQTQINDMVAEVAQIYMGGNSPTDHALKLSGENLKAEWNEKTFRDLVKLLRANIKIRRNSIRTSQPMGISPGSPYIPPEQRQGQQGQSGQFKYTATNPETGERVGSNDGVTWEPIQ